MTFGIRAKLLVFAALVWVVIFGIYGVYTYGEKVSQMERLSVNTARLLSKQIMASREIYTSSVVAKAMASGMLATKDYHDIDAAIPLPATIIKEISNKLSAKGGFAVRLISSHPINPSSSARDAFQHEALSVLSSDVDTEFFRFEDFNDTYSIRYMIADFATSRACVDCHNTYPGSPKTDYKLGDMMGGLEVTISMESEMDTGLADVWRSIGYGFVVILSMGLIGFMFIQYVVTAPLLNLTETAEYLANGDLTRSARVRTTDEIGILGGEMNEVVRNLHHMIQGVRSTSDEASTITADVSAMSRDVVSGSYEQASSIESVTLAVEKINAAITEIARGTKALADTTEHGSSSAYEIGMSISEVAENMDVVFSSVDDTARSTKEMSGSIKDVSDSIEQLSSAVSQVSSSMADINAKIKEVESYASETSGIAEGMMDDAKTGMKAVGVTIEGIDRVRGTTREAMKVILAFSERVMEIGKILDVIREVAEETNLLALNAAIIAVQSGEHGKSFSVVANEITGLAERTASSAKEVSQIVVAVQMESKKAVSAMQKGLESVEEGVSLSTGAGEALEKIVASARLSTDRVRGIARAAVEQARVSRTVVDATERVADMTHRIVKATREQRRGSELIDAAAERMTETSLKVREATHEQAEAHKKIAKTMEDVNRMVVGINSAIHKQTRESTKILEAIEAVGEVSARNIEKARETERVVETLAGLNKELGASVKKFKLKPGE